MKYLILSALFFFSILSYGNTAVDSTGRKFVVVIDAGHGGKDPGASHHGHVEKEVALGVTLKVGKALEKHSDIKVIYTRKTDVFIPLKGRAEIANKADADLFVSIHCNSNNSERPYGSETFVLGLWDNDRNLKIAMRENSVIYLEDNYKVTYDGFDPNSPASYIGLTMEQEVYLGQSILLASDIQKEFGRIDRRNRGVKKAGFLVLRETYMPSVLVETGFISNRSEGRYLDSKHGQSQLASAIVKGILAYKNTLNLNATTVQRQPSQPQQKSVYKGITFRVQIAAGAKKLAAKPYNFRGLTGVDREKEGGLYKYYYGETSDYTQIKKMRKEAKQKGYVASYIVAFVNGKKMTVRKAIEQYGKK